MLDKLLEEKYSGIFAKIDKQKLAAQLRENLQEVSRHLYIDDIDQDDLARISDACERVLSSFPEEEVPSELVVTDIQRYETLMHVENQERASDKVQRNLRRFRFECTHALLSLLSEKLQCEMTNEDYENLVRTITQRSEQLSRQRLFGEIDWEVREAISKVFLKLCPDLPGFTPGSL